MTAPVSRVTTWWYTAHDEPVKWRQFTTDQLRHLLRKHGFRCIPSVTARKDLIAALEALPTSPSGPA